MPDVTLDACRCGAQPEIVAEPINPIGGAWVALRDPRYDSDTSIPALAWIKNGTVYWDGGPGYCPFSADQHKIVRRYDWPKDEPNYAEFYREFGPPPSPLAQSGGWLAPDGRFWPCKGFEHGYFERVLSYMLYGEYGTRNTIENRGWIKIYPDGLCCRPFRWVDHARHDISVTPAQGDALLSIVALDPTSEYGRQMGAQLTYFLKEAADA